MKWEDAGKGTMGKMVAAEGHKFCCFLYGEMFGLQSERRTSSSRVRYTVGGQKKNKNKHNVVHTQQYSVIFNVDHS